MSGPWEKFKGGSAEKPAAGPCQKFKTFVTEGEQGEEADAMRA